MGEFTEVLAGLRRGESAPDALDGLFARLSVDEVAQVTGKSARTVVRDWQKARLILSDAIRDG